MISERDKTKSLSLEKKEPEFLVSLLCSGQGGEVGAEQSPGVLVWGEQKPCWLYRPEQAPKPTTKTQLMRVLMALGTRFRSHAEHRRRETEAFKNA